MLVGDAVRGRRGRVTIATKFGIVKRKHDPTYRGIDNRPEYVRVPCDASLARLRTDCIDLYYVHRVDPSVPIEGTVQVLAQLVSEGKVRHIGLSNVSAETLRRAHAVHPIAAVQNEYSLWFREPEDDLLPACRELGVGFVAYSPLGPIPGTKRRRYLDKNLAAVDLVLTPDELSRIEEASPRKVDAGAGRSRRGAVAH